MQLQLTRAATTAETIELGPRVTFFLSEEEAVVEATNHYNTCNGDGDAFDGSCEYCLYGPVDDMSTYLKRLPTLTTHYSGDRNLGEPWFF